MVGVRLLVAAIALAAGSLAALLAVVAVRLTTELAVPGWATSAAGLALVLLVQAIALGFLFSFLILGGRHGAAMLPRRDYAYFVGGVRAFFERFPVPVPDRITRGQQGHV